MTPINHYEGAVTLQVKAKHFENATYGAPCNCPLAKAAKDQFNVKYANEGVNTIGIGEQWYDHEMYVPDNFYNDLMAAKIAGFDDTVIRAIELTPTTHIPFKL